MEGQKKKIKDRQTDVVAHVSGPKATLADLLYLGVKMKAATTLLLLVVTLDVGVLSIRVLESLVELGDKREGVAVSGARLRDEGRRVRMTDFTICTRFNLKILGGYEKWSRLWHIADHQSAEKVRGRHVRTHTWTLVVVVGWVGKSPPATKKLLNLCGYLPHGEFYEENCLLKLQILATFRGNLPAPL